MSTRKPHRSPRPVNRSPHSGEGRQIGLDDREIPGGLNHLVNPETPATKPHVPVERPFPLLNSHRVDSGDVPLDRPEAGHIYVPAPVHDRPEDHAVPVYQVQDPANRKKRRELIAEVVTVLPSPIAVAGTPSEVTSANPAAGAGFSYTLPSAATLQSMSFSFTTSATVASRFPTLTVKDTSGNTVFALPLSTGVAASSTINVTLAIGITQVLVASGGSYVTLPNMQLQAGWQIILSTPLAGDQYSNINMVFQAPALNNGNAIAAADPTRLCARDDNRVKVHVLNEDPSNDVRISESRATLLEGRGALLPHGGLGYRTLNTQGDIFAVSMSASPAKVSVILETEVNDRD